MNRILALLKAAGVPVETPRSELLAAHGTRTNPFSLQDVLVVEPDPPLVPDGLFPLSCPLHPAAADSVPPITLEGWVDCGDETDANLRRAAETFEAVLGPGVSSETSNSRSLEWQDGRGHVRAAVFPPDLQRNRGTNAWQEREPRLAHSARIWIRTGWLPQLSEREREWLEGPLDMFALPFPSFGDQVEGMIAAHAPDAPMRGGWIDVLFDRTLGPQRPFGKPFPYVPPQSLRDHMARVTVSDHIVDLAREPVDGLDELFGLAAITPCRTALIMAAGPLLIVPFAAIERIEHLRMTRGRSPGYSAIQLICKPFADGAPSRAVPVISGELATSLDKLAPKFARWMDVGLKTVNGLDD